MPNVQEAAETLTPDQHVRSSENLAVPMDTEVVKTGLSALQKLRQEQEQRRARSDVEFSVSDFNVAETINMILLLDKYTKISVLNTMKFYVNMQCIRQAQRILPENGIERTSDGREQYDQLIKFTMQDFDEEGDYSSSLPAFMALHEHLRCAMYDDNLDPVTMESTLEFLTKNPPSAAQFEEDYDARVRAGARPGLTKRDFCAAMLETELRRHEALVRVGQAAIQFCFDLNVNVDRGFGDLPDWAMASLRDKTIDKLLKRWQRLDIRRTDSRLTESDRIEAQADQELLEVTYKTLSGRDIIREH